MDLWTKRIGETTEDIQASMNEWGEVLGKCTPEEIKHGLDTWEGVYPPNVFEFKAACLSHRSTGCHKAYKALPKPKADSKLASSAINHALSILRK